MFVTDYSERSNTLLITVNVELITVNVSAERTSIPAFPVQMLITVNVIVSEKACRC